MGTFWMKWWTMPACGWLLGSTLAAAWDGYRIRQQEDIAALPIEIERNDRFDPTIAKPDLSPEQVVKLQLDSLRQTATDPESLIVCYSLAAPSNRIATGPIDRFARLIRLPEYRVLVGHRRALVGRAIVMEDDPSQVAVFVTVTADSETPSGFRFYLGKQNEPPHAGCWMTTAVKPYQMPKSKALALESKREASDETAAPIDLVEDFE